MSSRNQNRASGTQCRAVVIWIDWYAYHLARFDGLQKAFGYDGEVVGLEMVGGIGVHAGLKFREDRPAGLPVETLLPETSWAKAGKLQLSRMLWQRLTELDPQVVLVPGYYTLPAIAAALWARLHGRRSVLMTESTATDHARSSWKETGKSGLLRLLFNWAVTGGSAHIAYLRQLRFDPARIARFYDVIGNDGLHNAVTRLREQTDAVAHALPKKYFLFVGRLAAEKNICGLLREWIDYRQRGGSWSLVLAGSGPQLDILRSFAAASEFAKDIVFSGHKTSQDLVPSFAFASCFVLPSTREPWGLVVNEAMAAGLPVIVSTRCGCAEDLVEPNRNGLLFDPAQRGELAVCLRHMESRSRADLIAMGEASLEKIRPFSPENFGQEILGIANALPHLKPQPELNREERAA